MNIKCAICREVLESPVILPCNDIVCKKHDSKSKITTARKRIKKSSIES